VASPLAKSALAAGAAGALACERTGATKAAEISKEAISFMVVIWLMGLKDV
jgi:ABC-type branched-subunit amino acid transport system permease subunit